MGRTTTTHTPNVTLFDWADAHRQADQAIAIVGENASDWWMRQALAAIARCASSLSEFTTDDVWRQMGDAPGPHDCRAMGAAMRRAKTAGVAIPTDRYRDSEQVSCHGRPKRLWVGFHGGDK